MMFNVAEIEPGFIFMVLIWLFSLFFSKKGKKKNENNLKGKISTNFEKLMEKLGELPNMDVNQSQPVFSEFEDDLLENEIVEPSFDFNEVLSEEVESIQDVKPELSVKKSNIFSEVKLFGTPIQKAIILKEILDKPRAFRPFNF